MTGKLRQRIGFYSLGTTSDGAGGTVGTWTLSETIWARVRNTTSQAKQKYGQTYEGDVYEVICRYNEITPAIGTTKFVYNSQNLVVKTIENVEEKNSFWKIICEAK